MRRSYSTLTPAVVRSLARRSLAAALPWKPFRQTVSVPVLLDLLLLTAALASSLSACVRRFAFPFSHETARQALDANLPPLAALADGLVDALHSYLPRAFRRRAWDVALDRHDVPFYGARRTPYVLGGPKKHGTNRFFSYATAVVVHQGQRWCLGVTALAAADGEPAVGTLLEQLRHRGIRVRCLLLDRGFFSGHVILALQARKVPFVLGVPRKGGRWDRLWKQPSGGVTRWEWKTERGARPVAVAMVRVCRRLDGTWRREVYAFAGIGPDRGVRRYQRAQFYRRLAAKRFGIETSYRQLNQGKALTTTTDPRRRLWWLGLGLLLRQVWVWCQRQLAPRGTRWCDWQPQAELRLVWLLQWVAEAIEKHYPAPQNIPLPQPVTLPSMKTKAS
jgi:hypothetical protein